MKKLLIVTQIVDREDAVLGFFHEWIREIAPCFDEVSVVCLKKGEYELPGNVEVYSLGKEEGEKSSLMYAWRFFTYVWSLEYDSVFVHMNPEYVVLSGWWWRLSRKRVVLWYTHKSVSFMLRVALLFVHVVCTASPESFRARSNKVEIVGHGIPVPLFTHEGMTSGGRLEKMISVGRISRTKRYEDMLEIVEQIPGTHLSIVGAAITKDDEVYQEVLLSLVKERGLSDRVVFKGPSTQKMLPKLLWEHGLFLNTSDTGSLDKAVLEAMAAGLFVVTTNEGLKSTLRETMYSFSSREGLIERVKKVQSLDVEEVKKEIMVLKQIVAKEHTLKGLISRVVHFLL